MKRICTSKNSIYLILGFVAILMIFASLRPLSHPDEGRYAEIGRWMFQSGDWLIPRLNGMPFFHKPPLLYWLEALAFSAFGVHPWVARLTPILHAGLMLVVVHVLMTRFGTEKYANRAAAMVGTSLAFLAGGQYINHDLMVATWISIAIGSFAIAFMANDKPNYKFAYLGFFACGMGILSKGLIGVALPGLVLLTWLAWTRQLKKISHLPWLSGLSIFALISVPWFILVEQKFPTMLSYMFGMHHFQRFTGSGFNNIMPWWFYIVSLVVLFFPWVFFSIIPLSKFLTRATKTPPQAINELNERSIFAPELISLSWIWLFTILVFFSIPAAKVIGYALPVIPPLAVLAVIGWKHAMERRPREHLYFLGLCVMNVIIALGLTLAVSKNTQKHSALGVGKTYACLAKPGDALYILDGYPYDLPFELQLKKPMLVVQDWTTLRLAKSDNWHSELLDAANFDPLGAKTLQTLDQLKIARTLSGKWLIATSSSSNKDLLENWVKVAQGAAWNLYHSAPTDNESARHELSSSELQKCMR